MPETLRNRLLTAEGMEFLRDTVSGHYRWFIHDARLCFMDDIRAQGLLPRRPDCAVPPEVLNATDNAAGIVCLNPVGSQDNQSPVRMPFFRLAIDASSLPRRLGLDWSYPESWSLRNINHGQIEQWGEDGAVLYVIQGTGSIVSYDTIPAACMKVCTVGKHGTFPSTWPNFSEVTNDEVMVAR